MKIKKRKVNANIRNWAGDICHMVFHILRNPSVIFSLTSLHCICTVCMITMDENVNLHCTEKG